MLFKDRYLIHVAGYNRGLVMRLLTGAGTPRELYARASARLFVFGLIARAAALLVVVAFANQRPLAVAVIAFEAVPLY